jgi:hypothetical protein
MKRENLFLIPLLSFSLSINVADAQNDNHKSDTTHTPQKPPKKDSTDINKMYKHKNYNSGDAGKKPNYKK